MDESQLNPATGDDLADQLACLRRQFTVLLFALIIVSGTLATVLFYQSHTLGKDLDVLEPQARMVVQNYEKNLPGIQKFVNELVAYGQRHPDFQPILKKYGIPLTPPTSTNSAPAK